MCAEKTGAANSYLLHLGAHPRAPRTARVALKAKLLNWNMGQLIDDATLVATELATNAMKRGLPFTLELSKGDTSVLIEVTDTSDGMPQVIDNTGDATAEEGRGMYLVDLLSKEWGVRLTGESKTVWARVGT
jgi:anti-sigma regulatory factor (Ser/Thr protein kinase)